MLLVFCLLSEAVVAKGSARGRAITQAGVREIHEGAGFANALEETTSADGGDEIIWTVVRDVNLKYSDFPDSSIRINRNITFTGNTISRQLAFSYLRVRFPTALVIGTTIFQI